MTDAAQSPYDKDTRRVRRRFATAAPGYDEVAVFQRTVAGRLLEKLGYMSLQPQRVLDLGAGTGSAAQGLLALAGKPRVVHVDYAQPMLQVARTGTRLWFSRQAFVCADALALPFPAGSFDLVFSNLMLQWCERVDIVILEVQRVLRQDGLFLFSTLGPDTLTELRSSWASVDNDIHVNAFHDMHDIGDLLMYGGFADPVMEADTFTLTYRDGRQLLRDLKSLGASNANLGRRRTLTGRKRLQTMLAHYDSLRQQGLLPATYEVVYGHAWNSHPGQRLDPHTSTFPLHALRRRGGGGP